MIRDITPGLSAASCRHREAVSPMCVTSLATVAKPKTLLIKSFLDER
jgi:hypothetical protein